MGSRCSSPRQRRTPSRSRPAQGPSGSSPTERPAPSATSSSSPSTRSEAIRPPAPGSRTASTFSARRAIRLLMARWYACGGLTRGPVMPCAAPGHPCGPLPLRRAPIDTTRPRPVALLALSTYECQQTDAGAGQPARSVAEPMPSTGGTPRRAPAGKPAHRWGGPHGAVAQEQDLEGGIARWSHPASSARSATACVVKPLPREEMTKSGIVLPDTVKEKPQEGEILAAGPGKMLDDGTARGDGRQGRRQGPLRQVRRDRVQGRGRRAPHREPEGHPRDRRGLTRPRRRAPGARVAPASIAPHTPRRNPNPWLSRSSSTTTRGAPSSAASTARRRGQGDDRAEGPERRPRQEVRLPDHHQRRRHDRSRHRARGPVREHGRAAPQGGRHQDRRRRRRRHDHRGRPRPGASSARASATSPPGPTRWSSSTASSAPSR